MEGATLPDLVGLDLSAKEFKSNGSYPAAEYQSNPRGCWPRLGSAPPSQLSELAHSPYGAYHHHHHLCHPQSSTISPLKSLLSWPRIDCRSYVYIRPVRTLSFLPLAHIFERVVSSYYIACGISVYFVDDITDIGKIIQEIRPTIMTFFIPKTEGTFMDSAVISSFSLFNAVTVKQYFDSINNATIFHAK